MKNILPLFAGLCLLIQGCVADSTSKDPTLKDPLGIGIVPTPPQESELPTLVEAPRGTPTLSLGAKPSLGASNSISKPLESDDVSIMSHTAGLLTVWALATNQWVWGYSPLDSHNLGDARIWKILTYPDGKIQIKNKRTNNCLSTYANGVIHTTCNANDPYQLWTINTFNSQAVQIKNIAKGTCLQTPTFRKTIYYSIFTTTCSTSSQPNLDQQWYITAPVSPSDHIFSL